MSLLQNICDDFNSSQSMTHLVAKVDSTRSALNDAKKYELSTSKHFARMIEMEVKLIGTPMQDNISILVKKAKERMVDATNEKLTCEKEYEEAKKELDSNANILSSKKKKNTKRRRINIDNDSIDQYLNDHNIDHFVDDNDSN